ncbi:MAG: RNA polymerase sigma factor [Thermoleophilaceae bacterium]
MPALAGRSPLLRLQSDEKLIALIRRGQHGAFEALVQRYQPRLLAFCRHMLNSTEDAEDVLQEVFAASFNAILADERSINARPWLYRIARNRCLNHLRRPVPAGQDSMDVFERDAGTTTADTVHKREDFRQLVGDVQGLPETQRTALLLREIDALSYDQIAETMDTTVPSVKSLLVRARVSLAEAAESRLLTCEEVRDELGQAAEGLGRTSAPVRRHVKACDRCRVFKGELRKTSKAMAAIYPLGPLIIFKKFSLAKLGVLGGGSAAAGGSGVAGTAGIAGGGAAGGAISAGVGTIVTKAAAGVAAAALVTAGAVEVKHSAVDRPNAVESAPAEVVRAPAPQPSVIAPSAAQAAPASAADAKRERRSAVKAAPAAPEEAPGDETLADEAPTAAEEPADSVQEESATVTLPDDLGTDGSGAEEPSSTAPPGESTGTGSTPPAPPAGERSSAP